MRFSTRLTIPSPCTQPWQAMTPNQQGRFCAHCQKTVVDFTAMTDAQVIAHLHRVGNEGCGRFRATQLSRILTDPTANRPGRWQWVSLLLSGWLSTQAVQAQTGPTANRPTGGTFLPRLAVPTTPSLVDTTAAKSTTLIVDGRVIDAQTRQAIPGATVVVRETSFSATADSTGSFRLVFPDYTPGCTVWVFVSQIGYSTTLHRVEVGQEQLFAINEDGGLLSETIWVGGYVVGKPTRWRRIRNWFRH